MKRTIMDVVRTLLSIKAYKAAVKFYFVFKNPLDVFARYSFGTGKYPCQLSLKTPVGVRQVTMNSFHDVRSLVVCFAKEDYGIEDDISCAVDFGSNIGMSGLYFLTRNPDVRAYLFEPLPKNAELLAKNLDGMNDRFSLEKCAIGVSEGTAQFVYEPSGRYGGLENMIDEHEEITRPYSLEVKTRDAAKILDDIIQKEGFIDVLKVNIEGLEVNVIKHLRNNTLNHIGVICAEIFDFPGELEGFKKEKYGSNITRFTNLNPKPLRQQVPVS